DRARAAPHEPDELTPPHDLDGSEVVDEAPSRDADRRDFSDRRHQRPRIRIQGICRSRSALDDSASLIVRPVNAMNTSSSDGRATLTERMPIPRSLNRRGTKVSPFGTCAVTAPSLIVASTLNFSRKALMAASL